MSNASRHTAAIHVLKAQLKLADADYRALLQSLTGKASSKDMTDPQRGQVRDHLQRLAERAGLAKTAKAGGAQEGWKAKRAAATPQERKVWAIWNGLKRSGRIANNSEQALNAWIKRTVGVDALRFCNGAQLDTLIESLKRWEKRGETTGG